MTTAIRLPPTHPFTDDVIATDFFIVDPPVFARCGVRRYRRELAAVAICHFSEKNSVGCVLGMVTG